MPRDDELPHGHALAVAEVQLIVTGDSRAGAITHLDLELAASDYPGAEIDVSRGDDHPAGTPLTVRVRAFAEDLLTGQVLAVALVRRALDCVRADWVPRAVFLDEVGLTVSWA